MSGPIRLWITAAICVLCAAPDNRLADAAGPDHDTIAAPLLPKIVFNPARVSGLGCVVEIEVAQQELAGYVPAEIKILFPGPLTLDRTLTFRFETDGESPPVNGLTVDVPLLLPQATRQQTIVRYLPSWSAGNSMSVSIWEDGRELAGSKTRISGPRGALGPQQWQLDERAVHWLYVSDQDRIDESNRPDLQSAIIVPIGLDGNAAASIYESDQRWEMATVERETHSLGLLELPTDWRAYQRYDAVIISAAALVRLSENPTAKSALEVWVRMGGALVVCGGGSPESVLGQFDFDGLTMPQWSVQLKLNAIEAGGQWQGYHDELTEQFRALSTAIKRAQAAVATPRSNVPQFNTLSARGIYVNDLEQAERKLQTRREILSRIDQPYLTAAQWQELLWCRTASAGLVFGLRFESEDAVPSAEQFHMIRKLLGYRRSPTLRRGVDPIIGDGRFRQWTIAGVAEPPVYTFMGLLSLFVVLVGPVAYLQTARYGRSYLMFAIAPTLAVMTTLAMFSYGIVADGFQTRARIRQLTWVDGASGDAVERVRATYFAGLSPSVGMTFSGAAEVMRYPEDSTWSWEDLYESRKTSIGGVIVDKDSQTFDASFLPARQQRQFVIHTPRENVGGIALVSDPTDPTSVRVQSALEFDLREVVVCDSTGAYWYLDSLPANQTRQARALVGKDISTELGLMYRNHRPLARSADRENRSRVDGKTYDASTKLLRQIGTGPNNLEGVFETWIRSNLQTSGAIPMNQFVATADISKDVIAYDDCEIVESIRYVFGTLP